MKSLTSLLLLSAIGNACAGDGAKSAFGSPSSTSGWSLQSASAGAAWRSLGSLSYRGSSRSQEFMIPSVVGGDSLSIPMIGDAGVPGSRTYENGFVNPDSTGSPDGNTWFWGYDSGGQVNGNELTFAATGSRSAFDQTSDFTGRYSDKETLESISPQLDFIIAPPSSLNLPFDGVLLSFWAFSDGSSNRFSNFSANQARNDFRTDYIDTYNIENIRPVIGAPYAGSANGPGPVIPILPEDRTVSEVLIGGDRAEFSNSVSTSLNLDGYSLAVGPTWSGSLARDWNWQASAGLTLNIFSWRARETETLSYSLNGADPVELRRWRDSDSGNDFRLGVYVKGEVIRQINDNWFASAYFQGEMADSVDIEVGDSSYEFKPRGFALGVSVGHSF